MVISSLNCSRSFYFRNKIVFSSENFIFFESEFLFLNEILFSSQTNHIYEPKNSFLVRNVIFSTEINNMQKIHFQSQTSNNHKIKKSKKK